MQHGRLLAGRPFHPGLLGLAAVHRNSSPGLSEILARSAFEVALSGTNAASCSGEASRGSPCTRFTISSNRASAISDMGMPHATMGTRGSVLSAGPRALKPLRRATVCHPVATIALCRRGRTTARTVKRGRKRPPHRGSGASTESSGIRARPTLANGAYGRPTEHAARRDCGTR
jgi:hypothetical protein